MKPSAFLVKTFFLMIIAGTSSLSALVEETLDPKSSIEITISSTSPNRIMVEGDVITDVIFDENKLQSFLHQKTGQAFLNPLKEIRESPTSVTIMTLSGDTQTFQVLAEQKPGEIVVLKESSEVISKKEELSSDYHSQTVLFLNELLCGNIPQGYGVRPTQEESFPLEGDYIAKVLRTLEGPFEEIRVLEIQNRSKQPETLKPSSLKRSQDLWVFLSKTYLDAGEKTLAFISTKKEF